MRDFPFELVVYALIFLGIVVFNYLVQRLARRAQQRQPAPELPMPEEERPLDTGFGRSPRAAALPEEVLAARRAPPRATPAPAPRRTRADRLFGSRDDLRRAIVAMTVLGPCRAQDPPRQR